jgi:Tol biopolymer transport system component
VFSPDGNKIWFVGGSAADSGIWEVAVDSAGRATGAPHLLHSVPPGNGHFLAASASGKRIAFVQMNTRDNLYSIAVGNGAGATPVPVTRDTRLRKTNPGFSPNGKLVSFGVAQVGLPNQIWIADIAGKSAQQVPVARSAYNPAWLSNDELSYWIFPKSSAQLWKWNIPEGRASLVFDSGQEDLDFLRMSPDGRAAAFQRNGSTSMNVWSISIRYKSLRQLTFSQTPIGWPSWSHDGKMLALEMKTGADTNIGVMPSGGGPITVITHDTGQNWPYSWSPEDDKIAFAAFRHGSWNVFSVSRESGIETQLTNYTAASTFVRYPEWSPTGAQIVYEYGETTGNIWMLESR